MYSDYLDRKRREAGKRYEHHVAQVLRSEGWEVEETGQEGMNDHGIDLIATKDGRTQYIQCKGWKRWRMIHEDVVSQLFGSVAAQVGLNQLANASNEIYIYSPAKLDPYAQFEAERLNIKFIRMPYSYWRSKR